MSMSAEQDPDQQSATAAGFPDKIAFPERGGGYGNPPVHTRFPKGKSGNPNGRPRGSEDLKTILGRVLNEKIEVRDGEKTRKITKYEAMLQSQSLKAIKGDTRAANFIQALANYTGLFAGTDEADQILSKEDAAILNAYVRQQAAALEADIKSGLH